jgi:hypothetical protein
MVQSPDEKTFGEAERISVLQLSPTKLDKP